MAIIFQEAAVNLPRLSQSSLYIKFEEQNHITEAVKETIANTEYYVKPEEITTIPDDKTLKECFTDWKEASVKMNDCLKELQTLI